MTQIAFIGAGSVVFTRDLLAEILAFPELRTAGIALHDHDPQRLETAVGLARQVARQLGAQPVITGSLDRREVLRGAEFVINIVQIGGHEATRIDFEIPARWGLRQTIADTIGIGGIFRHLRTAPFLAALAADIQELCPQAWLLNYTNPMSMNIAYLARVAPAVRTVGLCHSVYWTVQGLCEVIDVPFEEVEYHSAGVNHQAWLLSWTRGGESLYPRLDEALARDPSLRRRVRMDMYRRLGYFPTETSEHSSEYVPWYLRHDEEIARLRIPVGDYLRISAENLAEYATTRELLASGSPVELTDSPEYAPQVIHSIVTGTPRRIIVTAPNMGLIDNLPAEAAVEVPAAVDGDGIRPQTVGALPAQCAALNRTFLGPALLAVEAAVHDDPRMVRHAAMLDPNTAATLTLEQIWALCEELTAAHGPALSAGLREPLPN